MIADLSDNTEYLQMEDVVNGYITKELVKKPELLPIQNDTQLVSSKILKSFSILKLVFFVEDCFGIIVDDEEVVPKNFETVDSICTYVRAKREQTLHRPSEPDSAKQSTSVS